MKRFYASLIALSLLTPLGACSTGELDEVAQLGERDPDCKPEDCKPDAGEPPHGPNSDPLTVLTQDQYLGADFTPVFNATTPIGFAVALAAAVGQITTTNFQLRSVLLALQVLAADPDVVALQEVADITLNGVNLPGSIFRDYLTDTLAAYTLLGLSYSVIAQQPTWTLTAPLVEQGTFSITDRNVTLVRTSLPAVPVPYNVGCPNILSIGPGCLYSTSYTAPVPPLPVVVFRGYLGVDVLLDGQLYRVVNTRLENRFPTVPTVPAQAGIQSLQSLELVLRLATTPANLRLLVVGDFESSPLDAPVVIPLLPPILTPYQVIVAAGYTDTWLLDGDIDPEFTCCQAPNLLTLLLLSRRIDHIFARSAPVSVDATVLGDDFLVRLVAGLWPSLHGSVVATLDY